MSRSIAYLTSRVNFAQVSDEIPVTKQRNPEKVDPPDVFEGSVDSPSTRVPHSHGWLSHPEPNSKQERAGGRPHDESQTDRISHTITSHTGTGRSPGTPRPTACTLCYGGSPTWLCLSGDVDTFPPPFFFGWVV